MKSLLGILYAGIQIIGLGLASVAAFGLTLAIGATITTFKRLWK